MSAILAGFNRLCCCAHALPVILSRLHLRPLQQRHMVDPPVGQRDRRPRALAQLAPGLRAAALAAHVYSSVISSVSQVSLSCFFGSEHEACCGLAFIWVWVAEGVYDGGL